MNFQASRSCKKIYYRPNFEYYNKHDLQRINPTKFRLRRVWQYGPGKEATMTSLTGLLQTPWVPRVSHVPRVPPVLEIPLSLWVLECLNRWNLSLRGRQKRRCMSRWHPSHTERQRRRCINPQNWHICINRARNNRCLRWLSLLFPNRCMLCNPTMPKYVLPINHNACR